jgi:hypothetical protein
MWTAPYTVPFRTATGTAGAETVGTASRWTFGTVLLWAVAAALVLYVLYRRFG